VTRLLSLRFVVVAFLTPFGVGALGFLLAGLVSGVGADVIGALIEQGTQRRLNPLIGGVLGLAPVLLLMLILAIGPRLVPRLGWAPAAGWGGLIPIALLEFWAHWEAWTTYFPSRAMPGFPHGLELVIVPLFFAPVGMLVGVGLGLWWGRSEAPAEARPTSGPLG